MPRFLSYVGAAFLVMVVVFAGYLFFLYQQHQYHEAELETVLPRILAAIPEPGLRETELSEMVLEEDDVRNLEVFAGLGAFIDCPESLDNARHFQLGGTPVAEITLFCLFQNAEATVSLVLSRNDEDWQVEQISINSDIFRIGIVEADPLNASD